MRMWALAALAACGAQHAAAPAVRMSHNNEFPQDVRHTGYGIDLLDCKPAGDRDPALYRPLLEYARTQLLPQTAKHGFAPQGLDVNWGGRPPTTHADGVFDHIDIDPRSSVGTLYVGQVEWTEGRGSWGMGTPYCVHVITENGARTLVLTTGYFVIG